jgi:hypothetical protein
VKDISWARAGGSHFFNLRPKQAARPRLNGLRSLPHLPHLPHQIARCDEQHPRPSPPRPSVATPVIINVSILFGHGHCWQLGHGSADKSADRVRQEMCVRSCAADSYSTHLLTRTVQTGPPSSHHHDHPRGEAKGAAAPAVEGFNGVIRFRDCTSVCTRARAPDQCGCLSCRQSTHAGTGGPKLPPAYTPAHVVQVHTAHVPTPTSPPIAGSSSPPLLSPRIVAGNGPPAGLKPGNFVLISRNNEAVRGTFVVDPTLSA